MATREYLESLLRRVRERVPKSLYDELHAAALPSAGGRASWRSPKVTPLERLGLDSLTAAGVRRADDDALRACWKQLGAWHKQAGRKKQDQGPFARVAGYVLQEMQARGLDAGGPLAEAAMAKSTLGARLEDLPDVVPLALGAAYLERVDGGVAFETADFAEAALTAALAGVGLDDGSEHKAAEPPAIAPLDATPLYDLALVRSAPAQAPDGAGMWEIVEKGEFDPLEKGEPVPLTKAEEHTGAMVAVPVSDSVRKALAAAGVDVHDEELHITLVYLGDAADVDDETRKQVEDAVKTAAEQHGQMTIKVAGFGHFNAGKEGTPVYATMSGRGLSHLQAAIEDAVGEIVAPASEHGWVPHMTLEYIPEGDDLPDLPRLDGDCIAFEADKIQVHWAGEVKAFPLEGQRDVTKAVCPIICAQAEEQTIWYRIAVPGEKDTYGHEITEGEVRKAAHSAMQGPMGVKIEHQRDVSDRAVWVESYILPADIPNGATYHGKVVEDGPYGAGEWHGAIHYKTKELWEKVKKMDGGISWGGYARKVDR